MFMIWFYDIDNNIPLKIPYYKMKKKKINK